MNCKHNYARVNEPRAYSDSMINRGRTAAHRRSETRKVNLHIYNLQGVSHFFHDVWDIVVMEQIVTEIRTQIKRGFSSFSTLNFWLLFHLLKIFEM